MRLEEEWLASGQNAEFATPARPPEVDLSRRYLWPGCEKPIPLVVRHPNVTPHADIVPSWQGLAGENANGTLDHGFGDTRQGPRYTIGPVAHQEILDRVLELACADDASEVKAALLFLERNP